MLDAGRRQPHPAAAQDEAKILSQGPYSSVPFKRADRLHPNTTAYNIDCYTYGPQERAGT